ncbi:MAG TPA: hypothetical protein VL240_11660 [Candidatus Binatia bacterium]|nr:hypothetical protein [Candidatus Binatia bacterium]
MVPISGIYGVVHDFHRAEHEVLAIRGEEFPLCRVCKGEVRFHVIRVLPHVTHDFDLAGPRLRARKSRAKSAGKGTA